MLEYVEELYHLKISVTVSSCLGSTILLVFNLEAKKTKAMSRKYH